MAKKTKKAEETVENTENTPETGVETRIVDEKDGLPVLPTLEREVKVIPALRDEVIRNKKELVPAFLDYKEKLSQSNKTIRALVEQNREHLSYDEETQTYTYNDGEVDCTISTKTEIEFSVIKKD